MLTGLILVAGFGATVWSVAVYAAGVFTIHKPLRERNISWFGESNRT